MKASMGVRTQAFAAPTAAGTGGRVGAMKAQCP